MQLSEVGLCGLYCGLCASRFRIPAQASQLRETLIREGYDRGYFDIPGLDEVFSAFWKGLDLLAKIPCAGCRTGGGNPDCPIRNCALQRQVTICPECAGFPCEKLQVLNNYPLYIADAQRLRAVGLEVWVAEQEERCRSGFCYADVRFPSS